MTGYESIEKEDSMKLEIEIDEETPFNSQNSALFSSVSAVDFAVNFFPVTMSMNST
jgi:hypothetical protein